jgi:hypothetical protein
MTAAATQEALHCTDAARSTEVSEHGLNARARTVVKAPAKPGSPLNPRKMHEKGACNHCGVESSHVWRKGPLEKPHLCDNCGSRWRKRHTLKCAFFIPLRGL